MQENSTVNSAQALAAVSAALDSLPGGATRQEKTKLAAKILFLDFGIYPSAKVVREFTGQGSLTDISRDLQHFWDELRKHMRMKLEVPEAPVALRAAFGEALGKLWALSCEHADKRLEILRRECQEQVDAAQIALEAACSSRTEAWAQVDTHKAQLAVMQERLDAAEKRAEAQAAEIGGLEAQVEGWKRQAEADAAARKQSEEKFMAELENERIERRTDAKRFEGEINFAKRQIEAARQVEKDVREQLQAEKTSKDIELATYRQRMNKAEESVVALRAENAEVVSQKGWLEKKVEELQVRVKELAKAGSAKAPRAPRRAALKRTTLR